MRLLILGSCVSRDALNLPSADGIDLAGYYARSSIGSSMVGPTFTGVDVNAIPSAFQKRMVVADLAGTARAVVMKSDYDRLVIDVIDERFHIFEMRKTGALATRSGEFLRSGFKPSSAHVMIRAFTDAHYARWVRGWRGLSARLESLGNLDKVRVNRVYWATKSLVGDLPSQFDPEVTERANRHLDRMYEEIAGSIPQSQFMEFSEKELVADPEHRWGLSPYHFVPDYYEALLGQLD